MVNLKTLNQTVKHLESLQIIRVVSRTWLFGLGSGLGRVGPKVDKISGLVRTWNVLFVLDVQKYNLNNLAALLNEDFI